MLLKRSLIVSCPIAMGRSRIKILALTELGKFVLGIEEPEADRLGGPEHRYWKMSLAEHLRASGYVVTEEYPVGGGKTIDLVAERDGKRIAFEVETGKSDAAANVQKCLKTGVDKVIVVATADAVKNSLSSMLSEYPSVMCLTGPEAMNRQASAALP